MLQMILLQANPFRTQQDSSTRPIESSLRVPSQQHQEVASDEQHQVSSITKQQRMSSISSTTNTKQQRMGSSTKQQRMSIKTAESAAALNVHERLDNQSICHTRTEQHSYDNSMT